MKRWFGAGLVERFSHDRRGSIAVLFALIAVPVTGIVAVSIDYARASNQRSRLESAAEAAAQAASRHLGQDKSIIEAQVKKMLSANLPPELAELPHVTKVPKDRMSVEVTIEARVPTLMMGVVGVEHIDIAARGFARRPTPAPTMDVPVAGVPSSVTDRMKALKGLSGGGSAGGGSFPGPAPAVSPRDAEQALRAVNEQLQSLKGMPGLQGQLGGSGGGAALPPEAAAQIERAMRELQRMRR